MQDFLVFTLSAQIASMGDQPGTQFRRSLDWPARSSILGLIAAARGIDREDTEGQSEVFKHSVAVGIHNPGVPFTDFQTIETVPVTASKNPATRPDAIKISGSKTVTSVTRRQYRTGVLYTVAVWGGDLELSRNALKRPLGLLFFGRKSCPLSAPPAPKIVESESPASALREAQLPDGCEDGLCIVASDTHPSIQGRTIHRMDDPTCRLRWHFRSRPVTVLDVRD